MPSQECNSCHVPIWWATKFPEELNDKGLPKTIPVNHDSLMIKPFGDPKGTIEVWHSEPVIPVKDGEPVTVLYGRYLKKPEIDTVPAAGRRRGVSHFATCRDSAQWRAKKPAQGSGT